MLSEVQLIACLLLPSGCISLSRIYEGGARVVCDLCHTFAHLGPDPSGARVRQKSALSQKCLVSRGDNHYVAIAQFRTLGVPCVGRWVSRQEVFLVSLAFKGQLRGVFILRAARNGVSRLVLGSRPEKRKTSCQQKSNVNSYS